MLGGLGAVIKPSVVGDIHHDLRPGPDEFPGMARDGVFKTDQGNDSDLMLVLFDHERFVGNSRSEIILNDTAGDPLEDRKLFPEGDELSERDEVDFFVHLIGLRIALHDRDRVVDLVPLQIGVLEPGDEVEIIALEDVIVEVILNPRGEEEAGDGRLGPDHEIVGARFDKGSREVAIVEDDFLSQGEIFRPLSSREMFNCKTRARTSIVSVGFRVIAALP